MPLGQFTLTIGGERQDGTAETKAKLHLRPQGVDTLIDADADLFYFPTQFADGRGVNISLSPTYSIDLYTDTAAGEGESTTIGYEGWVRTDQGRVDFQIAAQEAGATVSLTDLVDTVVVPVSTAQGYVTEAEAARDAALAAEASAETAQTAAETAAASVQREQASGVAGLTSAGKLYETRIPDRLSDASLSATFAMKGDVGGLPVTVPRLDDFRADLNKVSPLLTVPTYDGSNVPVHPSVLYFPNGWSGHRWWMMMTPYPSSNAELENPSILVSDDGYTWTVPAGVTNPLVASPPGGAYNSDPCIKIGPDGRMHMWYRDEGVPAGTSRFLHMSSADGIAWTTPTVCTTENITTTAHVAPAVWYDAATETWVMIAVDHVPATFVINRATAPAPEGPWSSFSPVTLVGGPFPSNVWHIDAHNIGGEVIALAQIGGSSGGSLMLLRSSDQGRTLTLSPKFHAYGSYKSAFVPMMGPSGLALELFRSRLVGEMRRVTLSAQQDVGLVQARLAIDPYILGDTFTRADGAIGTMDSGTAWTTNTGSPAIVSNQASVSVNGNARVVAETSRAEGIVSMKIAGTGEHWMLFRFSTGSNYLRFGSNGTQYRMEKVVAGVVTTLFTATAVFPVPAAGDTIMARYEGDQISFFVNGGLMEVRTDSFNNTATQVGFQINNTTARIDNFTARRL